MNTDAHTLAEILDHHAKADLRFARQSGTLLVCQTKRGDIEITYHADAKRYSLTVGTLVLADRVKAADARAVLAASYVVLDTPAPERGFPTA